MYESLFERDLARGERIVWTGQPDPNRYLSRADIFLIPFSLLWGGFALYWEASVLGLTGGRPAGAVFVVFGIPFVVLALYFMVGRFFYQAWVKRNTYYALTTRRALILRQLRGRSLDAIQLGAVPSIGMSARADGSGTVTFGPTNVFDAIYGNTGLTFFRRGIYTPAFYDIPDAQTVAKKIEELREKR